MVLRFFLGSHRTLVAASAPFVMPLRDSDIPMNVPFTFSNKQPLTPAVRDSDNCEFQQCEESLRDSIPIRICTSCCNFLPVSRTR